MSTPFAADPPFSAARIIAARDDALARLLELGHPADIMTAVGHVAALLIARITADQRAQAATLQFLNAHVLDVLDTLRGSSRPT